MPNQYQPVEVPLHPKIADRIARHLPGYRTAPDPHAHYDSWTGLPVVVVPASGRPMNPVERTGRTGLGECSFWGPNHSADPIVTRDNAEGGVDVLLIRRADTGEWALPGGKLDPGETALHAAERELREETFVSLPFEEAVQVFRGYVSDPRNTDNAWFETTALHVHLPPEVGRSLAPVGGTDADDAAWHSVTPNLLKRCYADHGHYIARALHLEQ
jgi:ADP-ribose pyrophosphatase